LFGILSTTNKSLVCSLCGRAQKQEAWVLSSRSKAEELTARTAQEAPSQARREASANRRLNAGVYAALIFWPAGPPSLGRLQLGKKEGVANQKLLASLSSHSGSIINAIRTGQAIREVSPARLQTGVGCVFVLCAAWRRRGC